MDSLAKDTRRFALFARLTWALLGYDVLVIAWGAYVRATFSGDGCGSHWPLCNGELAFPEQTKTLVEASHRVTAGVSLVFGIALALYALYIFPRDKPVRRAAVLSAVFISAEALIGAFIVLFRYVAHDKSLERALSMTLHLTNTFFLLGSLALTAYYASGGVPATFRGRGFRGGLALAALGSMIALGMTGALAALGDTLFPARTLVEGLTQDLNLKSDILLKLRTAHPFVAVVSSVIILAFASYAPGEAAAPRVRRLARALMILVFVQLGLGALNVALLAPIPIQLIHLVSADAVWVLLVMLVWEVLARETDRAKTSDVEGFAKLER